MKKFHVFASNNGINAGIIDPKNRRRWMEKNDVTEEAIRAVARYMEQCRLIPEEDGSYRNYKAATYCAISDDVTLELQVRAIVRGGNKSGQ